MVKTQTRRKSPSNLFSTKRNIYDADNGTLNAKKITKQNLFAVADISPVKYDLANHSSN